MKNKSPQNNTQKISSILLAVYQLIFCNLDVLTCCKIVTEPERLELKYIPTMHLLPLSVFWMLLEKSFLPKQRNKYIYNWSVAISSVRCWVHLKTRHSDKAYELVRNKGFSTEEKNWILVIGKKLLLLAQVNHRKYHKEMQYFQVCFA